MPASFPAGRGVFDGNVKVERAAQQTDAKQLSRNLLLVPRATVNVKPNLQIVADDVKCTHGCTVSDLEESQLFYFRCSPLLNILPHEGFVVRCCCTVVLRLSGTTQKVTHSPCKAAI